MSWARIDDQWCTHRKVVPLSMAARGLWATGLSWTTAHRSPHLPGRVLGFLAMGADLTDQAEELVDAGLWHKPGHNCPDCRPIDEGWMFHHWDRYQRGDDDAHPGTRTPQDAQLAGALGNHIRWHVARGRTSDDCRYCHLDIAPDIAPITAPESDDIASIANDRSPTASTYSRESPPTRGDIAPESLSGSPRPDPSRPDPTRPLRRRDPDPHHDPPSVPDPESSSSDPPTATPANPTTATWWDRTTDPPANPKPVDVFTTAATTAHTTLTDPRERTRTVVAIGVELLRTLVDPAAEPPDQLTQLARQHPPDRLLEALAYSATRATLNGRRGPPATAVTKYAAQVLAKGGP